MGRSGVGSASGTSSTGGEGGTYSDGRQCNFGPRNPDGSWVAGVERGPAKAFPFPVGAIFGELTCLGWERQTDKRGNGCYHPRMRCSCGWEGIVHRSNIKHGRSTRCRSCAFKASIQTRYYTKGYFDACPDIRHRDRLLDRISAIVVRCTNTSSQTYPDYGGRGITVHPEWLADRVAFLRYLVTLDGWDKPQLQLDRTDNSKGYQPGNLRFVTRSVNTANKRRITAREVVDLRQRIAALEAENADLRHRYGRPAQ